MATIVAHFDIPYLQYLDETGQSHAPLPAIAQDKEALLSLYKTMCLTRLFDKKAIALQRTGKLGTYPPVYGQEAISSVIGLTMQAKDVLIPYYRDYGAQLQRGVKIEDLLAYWGGDERGNDFSNAQDLPISVPIASQCLHAAGVAFAFQYRKQARVALVSLGDGATSEGDFYEAMNVAGLWKLPLVFVVNNNQWAISVNIQQQTATQTLAQKAIAAGFDGIQVDGNDVLALHDAIHHAIEKARQNQGPTLIEALSYRLSDHTTADDAKRYQPKAEVDEAIRKEPLLRFKTFLINQGFLDDALDQTLQAECAKDLEKGVEAYVNTPLQPISSMFDFHFATLPDYLIEQRAQAIEDAEYA